MATTRTTWFGVIVEFSHSEVTYVVNAANTGAGAAGTLAALLAAFGITGPAAIISGIVSAVLSLGGSALNGCNAPARGIFLYVLWVGLPWCRTR